ncbi:protein trichome birefringence-like 34 [Actinidia eriantha]|uniref:protein trichome birefringence-like 34 n=1 Tax=Actinidia eriantha TaxID=165200 RepID=UPI00258A4BD1|nr:protein trichome birefringence-like 34 [Actinidia eriantha]
MLKDYNASIEHYWSPYLVESNLDHPVDHHFSQEQILGVHSIAKHARHWTNADILVFDSYMWWRRPKLKVLRGSFESQDRNYEEIETLDAFGMVLKTWSDWLEIHVNRSKTKIYFVTSPTTHERGEDWGKAKGENCYNETEPILKEGYHANDSYSGLRPMVENAIKGLKRRGLTVQIIDITQLSQYRKDAHTSIYRKMVGLTKEQIANPKSHADCIHWCIPGVPDVWNELLYAYIFYF